MAERVSASAKPLRLRRSLLLVAVVAVAGMIAWHFLQQPVKLEQVKNDLGFGTAVERPVSVGRNALPSLRAGEPPVTNCDRQAADPWDPGKRADGRRVGGIDAAAAIKACRDAVAGYPDTARFEVQLGRAYFAAGKLAEALDWFERAATHKSPAGAYELGYAYLAGYGGVDRDIKQALVHYRAAAEAGHPAAQTAIGILYATGTGVEKYPPVAMEWFRRAAQAGYPAAQNNLGEMYYRGEGAARDYVKAAQWVREAAKAGHPGAQYNLGYLYRFGQGVETSDERAMFWLQKAADFGVAKAMSHLASMYRDGRGVPADPAEAYFWFALASEQGLASAATRRDAVAARLTETERKAQLRRVAMWVPQAKI